MKLIEDRIHATENERSEEGAFLQLREHLLMVECPLHKPTQDKKDSCVNDLVDAARKLDVEQKIRNISEHEGDKDPHKWRQLISQDIIQFFSTFFIAAGR